MQMNGSNLKVTGIHKPTNTIIELVPGYAIVSHDGTKYVVGGWEKDSENRDELALFETLGNVVDLGAEERVANGSEIELGVNPLEVLQEEWSYKKAESKIQDSFKNNSNDVIKDEIAERVAIAKERIQKERDRRANEKPNSEEFKSLDKKSVLSFIDHTDSRSTSNIQEEPEEEELIVKVEELSDKIKNKEDKIDDWLSEIQKDLINEKDINPTKISERPQKKLEDKEVNDWLEQEKRKQAIIDKRMKKDDEATKSETFIKEKQYDDLVKVNQALLKRLEALENKSSFHNSPDNSNTANPLCAKPIPMPIDIKPFGLGYENSKGQFGNNINAVQQLDEIKVMQNARLIVDICNMTPEKLNILSKIVSKLNSGGLSDMIIL